MGERSEGHLQPSANPTASSARQPADGPRAPRAAPSVCPCSQALAWCRCPPWQRDPAPGSACGAPSMSHRGCQSAGGCHLACNLLPLSVRQALVTFGSEFVGTRSNRSLCFLHSRGKGGWRQPSAPQRGTRGPWPSPLLPCVSTEAHYFCPFPPYAVSNYLRFLCPDIPPCAFLPRGRHWSGTCCVLEPQQLIFK